MGDWEHCLTPYLTNSSDSDHRTLSIALWLPNEGVEIADVREGVILGVDLLSGSTAMAESLAPVPDVAAEDIARQYTLLPMMHHFMRQKSSTQKLLDLMLKHSCNDSG